MEKAPVAWGCFDTLWGCSWIHKEINCL